LADAHASGTDRHRVAKPTDPARATARDPQRAIGELQCTITLRNASRIWDHDSPSFAHGRGAHNDLTHDQSRLPLP